MFPGQSLLSNLSGNNEGGRRKVVDPVHGIIYFDQLIWDFIDTPHFQRLRKLKQLCTLDYVFPCATHTRFDHSIGTAYLASIFIEKLIQNNPEKYQNKHVQSAIKTVILAGLLHDIGHGPFCHAFDTQVVTQVKKPNGTFTNWNHMIACDLLIESMLTLPHLQRHLTLQQKQRVKALIKGIPVGLRKWQFQIIKNKKYGFDANNLDYFRRDSHFLRAKSIYINHDELMMEARIIEDQICYPTKKAEDVFNIFRSRYKLFKNYHFNVVNKGIELMIIDVLKLIKDKFRFEEACANLFKIPTNYEEFLGLTDDILDQVEDVYNIMINQKVRDEKNIVNFQKAVILLERLKNRDLYRFVKELKYYIIDKIDVQVVHMFEKDLKKQKIIQEISEEIADIHPQSIRITINDVGYGFRQYNPMKKIKFFRKQETPYKIIDEAEAEKLSMLRTSAYNQRSIKVYIRNNNYMLYLRVDSAFSEFRQKFNRKCQYKIKKQTGVFYLFEGSGGKKPANDKKPKPVKPFKPKIVKDLAHQKILQAPKIMRKINNPVFKLIYFDQMVWDFIDTPEFQRLRKINQLGCIQYVLPCCSHTVFHHSLGTAFLAEKMIVHLIENNPQLYPQDEKATAIKTVTLAGLLRKIGQGPFKGIFDDELKPKEFKQKWCQQASTIIFDRMTKQLKQKQKNYLQDGQIQRVKDLIKGVYPAGSTRTWQFQIINNTKNGIDVALLESMRSDPFELRAKNVYIDHDLLMKQARIIDEEISYPTKYVETVFYIFQSRYKLFKDYYNDPSLKSIELMLKDIIRLVKEKLNLEQAYRLLLEKGDIQPYQQLTDQILQRIEDTYDFMLQNEPQDKCIPNFEKAIQLMRRIIDRKRYIFVRQFKYQVREKSYSQDTKSFQESLIPQKIKKRVFEQLEKEEEEIDIQIDISNATFGLQTENPTKKVSFFRKEDADLKKQYRKVAQNQLQELSMLSTDAFVEKSIKVFLKDDKPGHFQKVYKAVQQVSNRYSSNSIFIGQSGSNPSPGNGRTLRPQNIHETSVSSFKLPQ